ncbi:MAG: hypothetical protein RR951_07185 [Ruthenibacterium sp.]
MSYIEHDQLDSQLTKLENVCAENGYVYRFVKDCYPVRIIITPDGSMDSQISMFDGPAGCNTKGSVLQFVFVDGDVYINAGEGGGISMSKCLQSKLRTIAEKIYAKFLQTFFIDTLESMKMNARLHGTEKFPPDKFTFEAIGGEDNPSCGDLAPVSLTFDESEQAERAAQDADSDGNHL